MHNDSPLSPPQVWTLANNSLEDLKNAAASLDILPPRHSQNRWEAPPQGVFKVNVTLMGLHLTKEEIPALE